MLSRSAIAVGESLPSTSRQARARSPASSCRSARPEAASSSSSGGVAAGIALAGTSRRSSRRSAVSSQAEPGVASGALACGAASSAPVSTA